MIVELIGFVITCLLLVGCIGFMFVKAYYDDFLDVLKTLTWNEARLYCSFKFNKKDSSLVFKDYKLKVEKDHFNAYLPSLVIYKNDIIQENNIFSDDLTKAFMEKIKQETRIIRSKEYDIEVRKIKKEDDKKALSILKE